MSRHRKTTDTRGVDDSQETKGRDERRGFVGRKVGWKLAVLIQMNMCPRRHKERQNPGGNSRAMISNCERQAKDVWNKVRDSLSGFETFSGVP